MSWQNRFLFVLIPVLLAGCGFQPLYGKKSTDLQASKLRAGVKIDSIPEAHDGQQLKIALEDLLNPDGGVPANPVYRLSVTSIHTTTTPIGVARDGTVSRYNVYMASKYVLYRNSDDKPISSGNISYVNSYNNLTNAYFSTYISQADATKRGITELSELYRQRLAIYLDAGAPEQENIKIEKAHPGFPPEQPVFPNMMVPNTR